MADPMIGRPFAMPMIKPFVPRAIQPWIYLLMATIFQLTGGVYLGQASHMVGTMSLLREDVMMIGYFGILGVAMPFPLLFRLKFRFTNQQLLTFAVAGMLAIQLLGTVVTWMPALCLMSYACCYLKLMATFECFSNIQLWMTPRRDFTIFFPLLYIVVLGSHTGADWMAEQLAYRCGTWHAMHWLMAALLAVVLLFCVVCLRPFRFMRPLPFVSIDWLGMVLWSALLLEGIWLFNYGEHYNWTDSPLWRTVAWATVPTAFFCIGRMLAIRHPYIAPEAFAYKRLWPILGMFVVGEWMNSTPKVLQNALTDSVIGWGWMQTEVLHVAALAGTVSGCLFCLWWIKMLRQQYVRLLTVGMMMLVAYQVMMYFYVAPQLNIERLMVPEFLCYFGYAVFFVTLTIYLQELMPFHHFFMGLTIAGFVRNGFVGTICAGWYGHLLRHHMAANWATGLPYTPVESLAAGIKQLYGATAIAGIVAVLLMMLWHVEPVRSTLKRMPYWNVVGRQMRRAMGREKQQRKEQKAQP